ncbi:hypothetical protein QM012_006131 [Aureobasidium pullulans]|uniref:Uncharacterized protein n=1 Tax=Aureobasidium pullulans TaxID=5580 RepID=A0ABR0TRP6_AURPU
MEQDDTSTPSPRNKQNNPLESRFASRSKATSGVIHETASHQRQSEASESSSGKNSIGHAIKSLLPHSTHPALGKKPKNNPRSPLPPTFQGQTTKHTPAPASISENELMEAHIFHSRKANAYLEELVRRRQPAPPAWKPPKNWQVSKVSEQPTLALDGELPRLRDVGSLASVDEESPLAEPSRQIRKDSRKDSALTQGVRRSIASAGKRPSSTVVRGTQTASRKSRGRARVEEGHIACVSRTQRSVIVARKAGCRVQDSLMLKNDMRSSRHEDQGTTEWISEDDVELVRMPARSISTVKIETYLQAETNLLHLNLKTAIPLQSESSRIVTRGSIQDPQPDQDKDALAEPDTDTQEPGKTTKPPGASSSSGAKGRLQGRESSKEERDAENPSNPRLPGPDDDGCPPAYVDMDGRGCLRGGCDSSQHPPPTPRLARKNLALVHLEELDIEYDTDIRSLDLQGVSPVHVKNTSLTRTQSEPNIHIASSESSTEKARSSRTMPRETNSHVGEGFRRMKLRKKAERPSSFCRAPEIQERGRTLERASDQEGLGTGIGLGINMPDFEKLPKETPDSEMLGEEMADDPKIQNYALRQPSLLLRRDTERAEQAVFPRPDDPVVAIQKLITEGGALLRTGRDEDEGLMCVSVDAVRMIRDRRRREREGVFAAGRAAIGITHEPCYLRDPWLTWTSSDKEEHEQELDQFVANFEHLQHEDQVVPEELRDDQLAKETKFESVPSTDGIQESNLSQSQPFDSDYTVKSDRIRSSSVGSDASSRTAYRTRDGNTTPRPGDTQPPDSLGKRQSFPAARPLPPPPTFPPDFLEPGHPDDDEEFVSLNDPSIRHHLAQALRNIYSGDMAAQNPAMANSAAPYTLGGGMPSAGHHSDMQHIWSLVQELSSVLQQNREQYDELQDGLARAQTRPTENGVLTNGDANALSRSTVSHAPHASSDAGTTALQAQLSDALSRVTELETECKEANEVIDYAEEIVEKFKLQIREYAHSHQTATIALHAHYNSLLETSRNETIQAQLTHQAWQASLMRLSENLRQAQRAHEEGSLPYRRRIAALKEENRILRAKAGWEPASDSEGSDDEHDVFDEGIEAGSS